MSLLSRTRLNIFTLCILLCIKQVRSNLELQLEAELEEFAKKLRLNDTILKYEEFQHKLGDFETYPLISSVHHNSTLCEGLQLVEEVREAGGAQYSKVAMMSPVNTIVFHDVDTDTTTHAHKRPLWNCLEGDSTHLVEGVAGSLLVAPPPPATPYNTTVPVAELLEDRQLHPHHYEDLAVEMEAFFRHLKNGFFVEAGASNGELDSHSLLMEATASSLELQCVPLYTLLLAVSRPPPTVHWLILDIEGAELQVLRTIPWDKVDIEVVSVETNLAGVVMEGSRQEILAYMRARGYTHRRHLSGSGGPGRPVKDDLFIREDVVHKYELARHQEL